MGTGITIVGATKANFDVNLIDISDDALKLSELFINKWCQKEISKGRITQDKKDEILSKINYSTDFSLIKNSCMMIEAVNENFDIKS